MHTSKGKTILLVEDEFLISMAEKLQLERYGYTVKTVPSGEEAIKAVESSSGIDLILMDINLGDGMDGTQAAEIILKNHDIPIVFVSSHTEPEIVEKTEKITSYGYVVKNSSITVLDASIKMAFKLFEEKIASQEKEIVIYEHELKYKLLHEYAGIGIGYYNLNGIVLSFNQLAAKHMGGVPEDFIGKSIYDLFPKVDADLYFDRILRASSSETPDVYEDVVQLLNGDMYFLSTYTKIFDINGSLLGIQVISQDITVRKRSEEAMRDSKQKAEMLLNIAAEIIISLDSQGRITLLNDSGHRILGYDPPELVGKNWFDACVPAENRESIKKFFTLLMEGESASLVTHEDDVLTKDGERKTIFWHNSLLKNKEGESIGLFSSGENITARIKAEKTLAESAKRFEGIIEGTHVGTWEWNVQTGETIFNSIWAEMIGYTLDELSPISIRTWEKFAHPEDLKKSEEILSSHFSGKTPFYEVECRMRHKDGHWVWVLDKGKVITWDADGKPLMMFGTHTDIMERKRTEQDLMEREERFRAMFHKNNAVMLLIDPGTGNIIDANESAAEFYGYAKEHLLDMKIQQINIMTAQEIEQQMKLALAEKCNYFTFTHRLSNGETKAVEVYSTPIQVSDKTLLYSIIHDITKQKSAEKRITSLLEEKELILKEVHHRIKNNMNTIGSLLSLQADRISEPAATMALNDAGNRVQSMSLLYDKLYRSLEYSEMSIKEYLPSLVDEVVANFPNSRMVDIDMDVQDISLDVKRLQPIGIMINELITNIMKYAFAGRERGLISVSATKSEDRVVVCIQDDGIGIPDSVTIETTTGFGLKLVHGLAQQLNGLIRIEREHGTRVVFEFPL